MKTVTEKATNKAAEAVKETDRKAKQAAALADRAHRVHLSPEDSPTRSDAESEDDWRDMSY